MTSLLNFEVKEKTFIKKYAEGANPETDEPMEVVEDTITYRGQEAYDRLVAYGVDPNQYLKQKEE